MGLHSPAETPERPQPVEEARPLTENLAPVPGASPRTPEMPAVEEDWMIPPARVASAREQVVKNRVNSFFPTTKSYRPASSRTAVSPSRTAAASPTRMRSEFGSVTPSAANPSGTRWSPVKKKTFSAPLSPVRVVGPPTNRFFFPVDPATGNLSKHVHGSENMTTHEYKYFDCYCSWDQNEAHLDTTALSPNLGFTRIAYTFAKDTPVSFPPPPVDLDPRTRLRKQRQQEQVKPPPNQQIQAQGETEEKQQQWLEYNSRMTGLVDIGKLTKWVVELKPRNVHDLKPLFILMQGLLKAVCSEELSYFLADNSTLRLRMHDGLSTLSSLLIIINTIIEEHPDIDLEPAKEKIIEAMTQIKVEDKSLRGETTVQDLIEMQLAQQELDRRFKEREQSIMKDLHSSHDKERELQDLLKAQENDKRKLKFEVEGLKLQLQEADKHIVSLKLDLARARESRNTKFLEWATDMNWLKKDDKDPFEKPLMRRRRHNARGERMLEDDLMVADLAAMGALEAAQAFSRMTPRQRSVCTRLIPAARLVAILLSCQPRQAASIIDSVDRHAATSTDVRPSLLQAAGFSKEGWGGAPAEKSGGEKGKPEKSPLELKLEQVVRQLPTVTVGAVMAEAKSMSFSTYEKLVAKVRRRDKPDIEQAMVTYEAAKGALKDGETSALLLLHTCGLRLSTFLISNGVSDWAVAALNNLTRSGEGGRQLASAILSQLDGICTGLKQMRADPNVEDLLYYASEDLNESPGWAAFEARVQKLMRRLREECGLKFKLVKMLDNEAEHPEADEEVAAVPLQAVARGFLTRRFLKKQREQAAADAKAGITGIKRGSKMGSRPPSSMLNAGAPASPRGSDEGSKRPSLTRAPSGLGGRRQSMMGAAALGLGGGLRPPSAQRSGTTLTSRPASGASAQDPDRERENEVEDMSLRGMRPVWHPTEVVFSTLDGDASGQPVGVPLYKVHEAELAAVRARATIRRHDMVYVPIVVENREDFGDVETVYGVMSTEVADDLSIQAQVRCQSVRKLLSVETVLATAASFVESYRAPTYEEAEQMILQFDGNVAHIDSSELRHQHMQNMRAARRDAVYSLMSANSHRELSFKVCSQADRLVHHESISLFLAVNLTLNDTALKLHLGEHYIFPHPEDTPGQMKLWAVVRRCWCMDVRDQANFTLARMQRLKSTAVNVRSYSAEQRFKAISRLVTPIRTANLSHAMASMRRWLVAMLLERQLQYQEILTKHAAEGGHRPSSVRASGKARQRGSMSRMGSSKALGGNLNFSALAPPPVSPAPASKPAPIEP